MKEPTYIYLRWPIRDQNLFRCFRAEIGNKMYSLNDLYIEEHKHHDNDIVLKVRQPEECSDDDEINIYFSRQYEKEDDPKMSERSKYF